MAAKRLADDDGVLRAKAARVGAPENGNSSPNESETAINVYRELSKEQRPIQFNDGEESKEEGDKKGVESNGEGDKKGEESKGEEKSGEERVDEEKNGAEEEEGASGLSSSGTETAESLMQSIAALQSTIEDVAAQLVATPDDTALMAMQSELQQTVNSLQDHFSALTRHQGTVKWFDMIKGFGFIVPEGESQSGDGIYVRRSSIVSEDTRALPSGMPVSYMMTSDEQGRLAAIDVRSPNGAPLSLGFKWSCKSVAGCKDFNEDRFFVQTQWAPHLGALFCVLDGHGGSWCVDYVTQHLPDSLHHNLRQAIGSHKHASSVAEKDIKTALTTSYAETDAAFLSHARQLSVNSAAVARSGATCIAVYVTGCSPGGPTLYVANLGDSRAVLCRGGQAVALSHDHKPGRADETKRITDEGGHVAQINGVWRVSRDASNVAEAKARVWLAVSRAFGNAGLKQPSVLVSAEPEVRQFRVREEDLFVVLACDGIWDVLSNQEVVDIVLKHRGDPRAAAAAVVQRAYDIGSLDNLTALVVEFAWQAWRGATPSQSEQQKSESPSRKETDDIFG